MNKQGDGDVTLESIQEQSEKMKRKFNLKDKNGVNTKGASVKETNGLGYDVWKQGRAERARWRIERSVLPWYPPATETKRCQTLFKKQKMRVRIELEILTGTDSKKIKEIKERMPTSLEEINAATTQPSQQSIRPRGRVRISKPGVVGALGAGAIAIVFGDDPIAAMGDSMLPDLDPFSVIYSPTPLGTGEESDVAEWHSFLNSTDDIGELSAEWLLTQRDREAHLRIHAGEVDHVAGPIFKW